MIERNSVPFTQVLATAKGTLNFCCILLDQSSSIFSWEGVCGMHIANTYVTLSVNVILPWLTLLSAGFFYDIYFIDYFTENTLRSGEEGKQKG